MLDQPAHQRVRSLSRLLALAGLAAVLLLTNLHKRDLPGYDDAIYADEARTMLRTGDWWNVRLEGRLDFDKPPLFIWLVAGSMRLFGVADFAARLPAALLGWGTLLLVYLIARELTGKDRLAELSLLVLLTTIVFLHFAIRAMTDVPFTFFFTLSIYCYLRSARQPFFWLICGLSLAAGVMIRSFLGGIPLMLILSHLLLARRAALFSSKYLLGGMLLALGLPLLWFAVQYHQYGVQFLTAHFSFTVENATYTFETHNSRWKTFLVGLLAHPLSLLKFYWPWLPLMLAGLIVQAKKAVVGKDANALLLVLWVLCVVLPFSLIERKPLRYILPAFPAFSILAALMLHRMIPAGWRERAVNGLIATCLIGGLLLNFWYSRRQPMDEMHLLAVAAASVAAPQQQLLLYANGEKRWDHKHQAIWYADRHCQLLLDFSEVKAQLEEPTSAALIIDKESFRQLSEGLAGKTTVLAESQGFVCLGKK